MGRKDHKLALTYVHGTNGSGKSTLARYLIMCAGGVARTERHPKTNAWVTYTHGRLALVGKYTTATGGADGVQPYSLVPKTALALLRAGWPVLIEGLMSPGVETCRKLHEDAVKLGTYVKFIRLEIGFFQSCENVKRRRMLVGNTKPFDPINVRKKQQSCDGWLTNLGAAHLPIWGLNWEQTRDYCLSTYRLNTDGAIRILD